MNKKKICLVSYDFSQYGGVNAVLSKKANELSEMYDVSVLSLTAKDKSYELNKSVSYSYIFNHSSSITKDLFRLFKPTLNYFNKNKIDVAILMGHYPAFIISVLRPFTKTKLVFSDHGALINQWNEKKVRIMRYVASFFCNKVITLTEQSRNDYIRKFHLPERKVDCIYNWIDLDKPRSQAYDIASKRIVSAGRFGKEKGFDMLVKAFAPVVKRHPDWHLDIFGDGEMMDTVRALVDEFDLNEQVHLLGMRSDLDERYKDYALYVLPSYREGMPLVLLEAKANRLPIISFDIMTGPREIVRDGVDGILIPPYDLDAMGEAIASLIENSDQRILMSMRSQETLDKFSKQTILKQWIELIETL